MLLFSFLMCPKLLSYAQQKLLIIHIGKQMYNVYKIMQIYLGDYLEYWTFSLFYMY